MSRTDSGISAFEATSSTHKFKDLWNAGHEATLHFETQAGQAWDTLRVALGHHQERSRSVHLRYADVSDVRLILELLKKQIQMELMQMKKLTKHLRRKTI